MKRKRQALNGEEMKWSCREKKRKGVATKGSEMMCMAVAEPGNEGRCRGMEASSYVKKGEDARRN